MCMHMVTPEPPSPFAVFNMFIVSRSSASPLHAKQQHVEAPKKKLKTTRKNNIAQLLAGHPIDTRIKTSKNHEKVIRTTPENKQNGCNDVCQT